MRRRLRCGLAEKSSEAVQIERDLFDKVVQVSHQFYYPTLLYESLGVRLLELVHQKASLADCNALLVSALTVPKPETDLSTHVYTDDEKLEIRSAIMDDILGARGNAPSTNPCGRCGSGSTYYVQQNLSHEDPTAQFFCRNCSHKWSKR